MKLRKERRSPAPNPAFPGYASVVAIASGAFATVYRAVELGTSRPVALKVLRLGDDAWPSPEPLNEQLETLALLSRHPNVVTLYRTFFTAEGHPVLVTELCRESLAQHLSRVGPMPATTVVPLAIKVSGALETAHRAGFVHGDVKPENILISAVGEPMLGDFGLAILQAAAEPTEHLAGETTLHAPPEAFEEAGLSPATDVYGLASSMYTLLLGRGPFVTFPGEAPASVILRLLRDPAPRPPLGSMPIALADLLEAALAKDPGRRPRSAASFAEALRAIEEAAGWPKTPYVLWDPEELREGPPALRPASVRGVLEAGAPPSEQHWGGEAAAGDGGVGGVVGGSAGGGGGGDGSGSGGGGSGGDNWKSLWAEAAAANAAGAGASPGAGGVAPAGAGAGAGAARPPLIEATWHPTRTGGGRESHERTEEGAATDEVGAAAEDGDEQAQAQGEQTDGGGADGDEEGSPPGPESGSAGSGSHSGQPPGPSDADEAVGVASGAGEPAEESNPPVTRHVIVPPAVERTVVVPEALPPRPSVTSHPTDTTQSHRFSTGVPRQAG